MSYIQIAPIRGNIILEDYIQIASIKTGEEPYKTNMYRDDFYTLCMKNPINNLGLRNKNMIVFLSEQVNINYLCSDFVRFCFSIFKNNQHNDRGELTIIPKQPISISEELKEYIESFLPDYYGLRK